MAIVVADREGNRVTLTGWVGSDHPARCKRVGSGRFHKEGGGRGAFWSFPLNMRVCRSLRKEFGSSLEIAHDLNVWARAEVRREEASKLLANADDAELVRVPLAAPALDAAMSSRKYQRVAAAWGAATGSFLLADQQGLGKSIETLATILEHASKPSWHLILSPSVAVDVVWASEVRRWLKDAGVMVVPLTGSLKNRNETLTNLDVPYEVKHVFVVANIESARIVPVYDEVEDPDHKKPRYLAENAVLPALHARIWDTVVVDECHRALIRTSGKPTQTRAGFSVLSSNARRRIALSGTPMRGKPEQLWGTLNWLRPDVYTSYWNWVKQYFQLSSNGFSNYVIGGFAPGGHEKLAADLAPIMLRRTKAEVLPELPAKQYAGAYLDSDDEQSPYGVWVEPLPAQSKQIKELVEDGMVSFKDGEVLVNGSLALYTRMKQLANAVHKLDAKGIMQPTLESPKYKWLLNFVEELDGQKLVVASQFTAIIDAFAEGLRAEGYTVSVLTGKTPQKKRARLVEQFQTTDEVQIFMLNTKAGGVALTLDEADYLVILDETTIPDDQEQVEDRIHRTSRIHNVTIYYLRTLDTLDEEIGWIAAARLSVGQYLLDGARGVKTARALYNKEKENRNGSS